MTDGAAPPDAIVRIRSPEDWVVFKARLRRPQAAATQLGVLMERVSGKAFREQRLGDIQWAPRSVYVRDSRGGKYLANVAGILSDFRTGKTPPARRFEPTPALVDTNTLKGSVHSSVALEDGRATITTGTVQPYAGVHFSGGTTSVEITPAVKAALAAWISTKEKSATRATKARPHGPLDEKADKKYTKSQKMGGVADGLRFLLHQDVWRQRVPARPFIGVTDEVQQKAPKIFALKVAKEGGASA